MAFRELEKRKHKNVLEKQYSGARANIVQKPYGATLSLSTCGTSENAQRFRSVTYRMRE